MAVGTNLPKHVEQGTSLLGENASSVQMSTSKIYLKKNMLKKVWKRKRYEIMV